MNQSANTATAAATTTPSATRALLRRLSGWYALGWGTALLVLLPVLAVLWIALTPSENIWPHLAATVLPVYIKSTLILMLGTGVLSAIIGAGSAWLVTMCQFPGRRWFEWALLLPFAIPAYVVAYVYTDLMEYAGPIQTTLRELFGWQTMRDYWFPEIRSMGGAITMLTLVLYPYVYLLARASFLEQSMTLRDASRMLGCSATRSFLKVSLPIARPAIAVGLSLVAMEAINDFGTVDFFAVKTLSAGVYDAWLNMGNVSAAAQISTVTLIAVILLITIERLSRARAKQFTSSDRYKALQPYQLRGTKQLLATLFCLLPVLFGFILPAGTLAYFSINHAEQFLDSRFLGFAWNSFSLAAITAVIATLLALLMAYSKRLFAQRKGLTLAARMSTLGYALPGAVLAIGVIVPLAAFDNSIDAGARSLLGFSTGLLLSGTPFALVFAYCVRFIAVSGGSVEASLSKVTPGMDMAARSLGANVNRTLRDIHLPLIRGGLLTAVLVVFVDTMKELPATLILRPFNYDTLATYVYQYASDERIEQCAPGALLIVLVGIVPVILLSRTISASRQRA